MGTNIHQQQHSKWNISQDNEGEGTHFNDKPEDYREYPGKDKEKRLIDDQCLQF